MMNVARRQQGGILGERELCLKMEGQKPINVRCATAVEHKGWRGLGLLADDPEEMNGGLRFHAGLECLSGARGS